MTPVDDNGQTLECALLALLGADDALSPRALTAREMFERLAGNAATEVTPADVERALRALSKEGLVDAFHEPYTHSRYQITRKGRSAGAAGRCARPD